MSESSEETESQRLAALEEYKILDTPADGAFDRITALAARFFDVPISLISLVDEDRIWFKSHHGLALEEIDRAPGLCASVIFQDEAYVVENAIEDPRTLSNPLVAGKFGLRFYAGAPLITADGHRLGTINVLDFTPRTFDDDQRSALEDFAQVVMDQMDLRLSARQIVEKITFAASSDSEEGHQPYLTICAWTKRVRIDDRWISFEEFLTGELGANITHGIHPEVLQQFREDRQHHAANDEISDNDSD